jgi:hypothetical protein
MKCPTPLNAVATVMLSPRTLAPNRRNHDCFRVDASVSATEPHTHPLRTSSESLGRRETRCRNARKSRSVRRTVPARGLDGRDQRITHPLAGREGNRKGTPRQGRCRLPHFVCVRVRPGQLGMEGTEAGEDSCLDYCHYCQFGAGCCHSVRH